MRGLTLERDKAIVIVMVLVLIFIFVIWAFNVNTAQAQITYRSIIYMHCKEWQDVQCDPNDALSIMINIEGEASPKSFAQLCAKEYNNDENQWDSTAIEGCKNLCMGCPR
jgi:hypothetical protein